MTYTSRDDRATGSGLDPSAIVDFWRRAGRRAWFGKSAAFDEEIRRRFEPAHHAAARGELDDWGEEAAGALALVLLLDQVPRNLWRRSPHAFATDPLARRAAGAAILAGFDRITEPALRIFFYLPFEHSEDLADQERAVRLFEAMTGEDPAAARSARAHRDIIARFGRFPHRNRALGRVTTAEEQRFLDEGGFAG